jgi:hypothetical protein
MKRSISFLVAMIFILGVYLLPLEISGRPIESFGYYYESVFTVTGDRLLLPGFRAEKVEMLVAAGVTMAVTVYVPYGPLMATDSFIVSTTAGVNRSYYGPTSDTMRVDTDGASTCALFR